MSDSAIYKAMLGKYIEQYLHAAISLPDEGGVAVPRTQLRGQLVELALKYFLLSRGESRYGHDLIALASESASMGLELTQKQIDYIAGLNELYYLNTETNNKYASRYPDPVRLGPYAKPDPYRINDLVGKIVGQSD